MISFRQVFKFLPLLFLFALALIFPFQLAAGRVADQGSPINHHGRLKIKQGLSTNWSGYAAQTSLLSPVSGSVSFVQGDWVVPTLTCTSTTTYSSAWVGIDGYSSPTVEQLGTGHDCYRGKATYYVWYEMYPKAMRKVNLKVNPGNSIHAQVSYLGNRKFQLILKNLTTGTSFSTIQRANALRQSAEWVAEAPSSYLGVLPLANFGTINFSNSQATINSHTGPINDPAWENDPITMVTSSLITKAIPSSLDTTGEGFSVAWQHQ